MPKVTKRVTPHGDRFDIELGHTTYVYDRDTANRLMRALREALRCSECDNSGFIHLVVDAAGNPEERAPGDAGPIRVKACTCDAGRDLALSWLIEDAHTAGIAK